MGVIRLGLGLVLVLVRLVLQGMVLRVTGLYLEVQSRVS